MTESTTVRYAGFWIRFLAELIDSLILTLASWALELLLLGVYSWVLKFGNMPLNDPFSGKSGSFNLQVLNSVLYVIVAVPYFIYGHYRFGTTLGKRPLGVYVVNQADHGWISWRQSISRTFGYLISYIPFLTGFLMAAFHPEKRALHDLIAGTVSIRREKPLPARLENG